MEDVIFILYSACLKEYPMKKHYSLILFAASWLLFSCDSSARGGSYEIFDYNLQGTWSSNDPSVYSGDLEITINRITINGYSESQWPDSQRPFREFLKGIPLKGYSEEGKIYIEDEGVTQDGIPYIYWEDYPPPDYSRAQFLRFTFGGRKETLQKQE